MKILTNLSKTTLLFLCLSVISLSCKKHNPDEVVVGEAKIKVVNAALAETNQDVYVDLAKITDNTLAFGEASAYVKIPSGIRSVAYTNAAGASTGASINFTPSITYTTFLVSDRNAKKEIVSYEDNLSNTESGKAKLKLINLSPYYLAGINVSVQAGTQFVNGLAYKEASAYFAVEAGMNLRYNVVGSGTVKTIANLEAGKIYTIWFSGNTTANIDAHVITDN